MMKLYTARHGEATLNAQGLVCGSTDAPLTEKGRKQARDLAKAAARFPIGRILASPLGRAQETARAVSEACGVPVETDDRLAEIDYGIYEGTPRDGAGYQKVSANRLCAFRAANRLFMLRRAYMRCWMSSKPPAMNAIRCWFVTAGSVVWSIATSMISRWKATVPGMLAMLS